MVNPKDVKTGEIYHIVPCEWLKNFVARYQSTRELYKGGWKCLVREIEIDNIGINPYNITVDMIPPDSIIGDKWWIAFGWSGPRWMFNTKALAASLDNVMEEIW